MSGAAPATPAGSSSVGHSKAFETLVQAPDDLVGLIAYALYKQSLREDAAAGKQLAPSHTREPTPTMANAFRGDATGRLQAFANAGFEDAADELVNDRMGKRIDAATADLKVTILNRTKMSSSIGANMIAWFLSVLATLALVALTYAPDFRAMGLRLLGGQ